MWRSLVSRRRFISLASGVGRDCGWRAPGPREVGQRAAAAQQRPQRQHAPAAPGPAGRREHPRPQ